MKTVIHIGQHKTGTTSIQKYLQDNREVLAQHGLYVPSKIAGYSNPSQFILNVYALDENRYSPMKEKIIRDKGVGYLKNLETELKNDIKNIYDEASSKKCSRVIWSNEGLYLLNTETEYKRLIDLFSEHSNEIGVVCCFRDVDSYRESYKKQLARQNISLSNNTDSYRYLEPDSWLFDYEKKKDLLSRCFDECIYFSYDPQDNVTTFLDATHINRLGNVSIRLNETKNTHNNMLQWMKKRFAIFYR
jgi:hypothetical protein